MLRAFNGECDSLISKVKWNNVNQMKERMYKLFESVNKLGEGFSVYIDSAYFKLRQQELILEYEYQVKRKQEKEEMKRIQDELREEEKVKREIEIATRQAEKEEAQYEKELSKAKSIVENAQGEEHEKLLNQIKELELKLSEAQDKKDRALSMAQQTK
jgi:electron transfer flavoprotein alpha subunit